MKLSRVTTVERVPFVIAGASGARACGTRGETAAGMKPVVLGILAVLLLSLGSCRPWWRSTDPDASSNRYRVGLRGVERSGDQGYRFFDWDDYRAKGLARASGQTAATFAFVLGLGLAIIVGLMIVLHLGGVSAAPSLGRAIRWTVAVAAVLAIYAQTQLPRYVGLGDGLGTDLGAGLFVYLGGCLAAAIATAWVRVPIVASCPRCKRAASWYPDAGHWGCAACRELLKCPRCARPASWLTGHARWGCDGCRQFLGA
jgi:hypothetical protein